MAQPVRVENDAIRMEVWPHLGGKVASIVDKADKFEMLYNYPSELPEDCQYDLIYGKSWYAGWDECFPAVSPSPYSGHPYDGIAVPDHGELWSLPTTAIPTKDGITTVWHGLRFGYRLTRNLFLDGATITAEYTLVNLAPFPFRFVWAQHPLMSLVSPVELDLAGAARFNLNHDGKGDEANQTLDWPRTPEGYDLSKLKSLPAGKGWKIFSADAIQSPLVVRYPSRGRRLQIEYGSESGVQAYWGVWINTGGWAGHHDFGIEPTTGRFGQIDRSIRDGSAGQVGPMERTTWFVRWSLA